MDDLVARALHAARRHFEDGGFLDSLSSLFSGPDVQSTGDRVVSDGTVNWGSPESPADFVRADKAAMALAKQVAAPDDDVTGSIPARRAQIAAAPPAPAPEPSVNIPFTARERGMTLPDQQAPDQAPVFPYTGFNAVPPNFAMPSPVAPDLPAPRANPDVRPMAYAPATGAAQAPASQAIGAITSPLAIHDISDLSQFRGSAMGEPQGIVFHHTGGRGTPEGVINTLNNRRDPFTGRSMVLGTNYIIDRDGSIYAGLPPGTTGAHILPSKINNLTNANSIGVEVIANDNDDVTPEQIAAGQRLHATLSSGREQPLPVFGHGELNPGHKMPDEGLAIVNPIRMAQASTPSMQDAVSSAPTGEKFNNRAAAQPRMTDLTPQQTDYIIRTIAAESSGHPEESQGIANVIMNRINSGRFGANPEAVLFGKNQFEPWGDKSLANYPLKIKPGTDRYQAAAGALDAALQGSDNTAGATYFWGPGSQYARGQKAPGWAKDYPDYTDIGATRFHREGRADGGDVDQALHMVRRHFDGSDGSFVDSNQAMRNAIASIDPERSQDQPVMDPATMGEAWDRARRNYQNFPIQEGETVALQFNPSVRQEIGAAITGEGGGRDYGSELRRRAGEALVGSSGLTSGMGALDFVPGASQALGATDIAHDLSEGNYASAGANAALPVAMTAAQKFAGPIGKGLSYAGEKIAQHATPIAAAAGAAAALAPDDAEAANALKLIRAYHGSPYKFDRFDLSKIGAGEGNQAYGHGLYFAEHEPTAQYYRDTLAHKGAIDLEQAAYDRGLPLSRNAQRMIMTQAGTEVDPLTAAKWAQFGSSEMRPYDREKIADLIDAYRQSKAGHMYDVNIHADPEQLLNWDKPLREQSPNVRDILASHLASKSEEIANRSGFQNFKSNPQNFMDVGGHTFRPINFAMSNDLESLGIPGIKYLDAGSLNTTGVPTHNYVIFNDKLININRRYAEGGQIPEGTEMREHHASGDIVGSAIKKIISSSARSKAPIEKIPAVAERYPLTAPPVPAIDRLSGETYLAKDLSPEALAVQKARKAAQANINAGNYTPFFPPEQRFDVNAANYPAYDPTTSILMKKPATQEKYNAVATAPEATERLNAAYQRGLQQKENAGNWYHMGQLEAEFIKEYGPEVGPQMFKRRFADPMAATTGGADPTSNLMMAQYGNVLSNQGVPVPKNSYEFPFPVGGRYAQGNMDQYNKMIMQGAGVTPDNPKRYNFSNNFTGTSQGATIDEQMSQLFNPKMNMPPAGTYGHFENALADQAAAAGVDPRYFQEVAWAGKKDADTKGGFTAQPMISVVNEAIERTHQVTGMPREEIVRRGLVRGEIPLYGAAGATAAGAAAPELMGEQPEQPTDVDGRRRGGSIVDHALMLLSRRS